ncbi:MAG: ASCH domain-containing protein [Bacilli bacterium]|nr:ASCH domain-containing protein [Bacilli bacterium]
MQQIYLKIRDHFIDLIKKGIKTHEYRLADSRYANIKVGDVLVLISNQNQHNYIRVTIESIEKYSDWNSALNMYWKKDFEGLFSSYDDAIKECYKFYSKDEVDKYGIIVFTIKPFKVSIKNARYLFDTNIIIERESMNNVSKEVSLCFLYIDKLNGIKFIHPQTINEINKYQEESTKNNMIKKLEAYQTLISSSQKNDFFDSICSKFAMDENSKIDNEILLQVFNGNVDYLITSDRAIIRKANQLYLNDYVLTPNDFLQMMEKENPSLIEYDVLSIELVDIGTLNIDDEFFDSLREDYGGSSFNTWLKKKSNEKAYVFRNNGSLQGFLYLKTEDENENYLSFIPFFTPAKRLKIGTFKITMPNLRLGERFMKIVFDNAIKREVDEVYVTMFEEKRSEVKQLRKMMEEWGFVKKAVNTSNGEIVLVKSMKKYDETKSPKFNYPLIKKEKLHMFLPIKSQYHTKLFPDLYLKNENIKIYDELACRYAIEKIYVCGWNKIQASPGDIMCIYRMGDYNKRYTSVVSGLAILNEVINPHSEEEFINECKNKSVFTEEELRTFFRTKKYRTIIKVLFLKAFDNKVNLNTLYVNNILIPYGDGARINTFINEEKFKKLIELGEK